MARAGLGSPRLVDQRALGSRAGSIGLLRHWVDVQHGDKAAACS